jgi:pimeloyl-ACP methyl ester carboxylesterase
MRDVEVPQGTLRVREAGTGPRTLVLSADPPNVLEMYGPLMVALKRHARVVAFEPSGFARSRARRRDALSLDGQADATIALLDALKTGPSVLALPCLGAYASLRVARKRPDLVAGIVAIQAPAWREERAWIDRIDRRGVLRAPIVGPLVSYLGAARIARGWYRAAHADPEAADAFGALAVEAFDHGARFPLGQALRAAARAAPPPAAAVPTLVVWGAKDRSQARSDPAGFREHAPDAEVVAFEDAGHFPELEQPRRFADVVGAWMARL